MCLDVSCFYTQTQYAEGMTKASPKTVTTVYICTTCDRRAALQDSAQAEDGKKLFKNMRALAQEKGDTSVKVRGVKCMGGCERACSVGINAPKKQAVLFVDMNPELPEDVWAVVKAHQKSRIGRVLYKDLPEHLHGRFLCRIPQAVS